MNTGRAALISAIVIALLLAATATVADAAWSRPVIACGLLLTAVLVAVAYRYLVVPLRRVLSGIHLLRAQDFASRLRPVGQRDTDSVVAIFNDMMDALHRERSHIREQSQYLALLVEASPMGVINFDYDNRLTDLNPAAARMLGSRPAPGTPAADFAGPLGPTVASLFAGRPDVAVVTENTTPDYPVLRCSRHVFFDHGFPRSFILMVSLEDEVRKAERSGYTKAIRLMAHEVNNSIGAVGSAMQTLGVLADDLPADSRTDAADLIEASSGRLEQLRLFVNDFATLARLPEPARRTTDMSAFISRMTPMLRSLAPGVEMTVSVPSAPLPASIDEAQMEQAVVNIVKNAAEAVAEGRPASPRIAVTLAAGSLRITDNGIGLTPAQARQALSNPFFTTKPSGQGIGLTLTCDILRNHGFRHTLSTDPASGLTTFAITLPEAVNC